MATDPRSAGSELSAGLRRVAAGTEPFAPTIDAASRPLAAPARFPFRERLGFRLSLLLAVALLPLGLISLLQASAWLTAAREQGATGLIGETLRAASPEALAIHEAQGAAAALAQTIGPLLGDDAACDAAVTAVNETAPHYSVVVHVPASGRMTCGSYGREFDYSELPLHEAILANPEPGVHVQARGPVTGTSVVLVIHPLPAPGGRPGSNGYVGIALPHAAIGGAGATGEMLADFITFNAEGTVLTSSEGTAFDPVALPMGVALGEIADRGEQTSFTARAAEGEERFYAMVPVIEGQLFALGSVPVRDVVRLGPVSVLTPFLLAALMWVASLVVAWVAAERLVSRHIRRLGRAIRAFASGSRVVGDLGMEGAPAELREVGQAFLRMTDTILHDEAELEDTVHQREVLLREVHHRVKNNLQLIASIMNMQMRRAKSPETKALMKGLQERVMSLATVHKELYQTTGLADVQADELLGDLVRQIVGMASAPGRTFRIESDFAPIPLTPDQAVPLSLLLTEGLTNAIKYAEPAPGETSPRLSLRFAPLGGDRAELVIANTARGTPSEPSLEGTGLGSQLVGAFASQIGGEVRSGLDGGMFTMRVEFVVSSLRGGEQRHGG